MKCPGLIIRSPKENKINKIKKKTISHKGVFITQNPFQVIPRDNQTCPLGVMFKPLLES